jgi:uncharacterized protein GlcG (DUF336 family)
VTSSYEKRSISAEAAQRLVAAAAARATELSVPMCIAVCDESGQLKAFLRMDGAAQLSVDIAQDKAYTAIGFGMPSHAWYDFIKQDGLEGPLGIGAVGAVKRLVVFGGGYPIREGDAVIGGIGVSGGHYAQDMDVAEAALAAF